MTKKRVTRKQLLKEPDEFITTTGKVIQWARDYQNQLIYSGVAFLVLVIAVLAWGYYQNHRKQSAAALYSQAMATYQAEGGETEAANALAAVRADLDLLVEQYADLPAGRLGRVMYGHFCLAGKALDDAVSHYKAALDDFENTSVSNIIINGLGAAYTQMGAYPEAIEQFKKIAQSDSPVLKAAALFHLGRLYDQLGQDEERQKVYLQIQTDFPETQYAQLVGDKVE